MEQQLLEKRKRHKTLQEYIEEKEELMKEQEKNLWKLGELASNVEKDYGNDSFGKWVGKTPAKKTAYTWKEVYELGENIKILGIEKFEELKNKLSFHHFREVLSIAKENLEEAIKLLQKAVELNYSCDDLREEVKGEVVRVFDILLKELKALPVEDVEKLVVIIEEAINKLENFDNITLMNKEVKKLNDIADDIRNILSNVLRG